LEKFLGTLYSAFDSG